MKRGRRESRAFRRMAGVFKLMVADVCDRTGDTEAELAEECQLGHKSFLNNMCNGHAPLPVDVLIRFTKRYRDRRGVEELLRLAELESPAASETDVMAGLMRSQRETLEFHESILEAIRDGEIDGAECDHIERDLNELITSAKAAVEQCKALRRGYRERGDA